MARSFDTASIVVLGASPDSGNRNAGLRRHVVDGFASVVDPTKVMEVAFERAREVVRNLSPDLVIVFGSCMPDDCDYIALRDACDTTRSHLAFWLHDDPYEFDFSFKVCEVADTIFSNDHWASKHYDHHRVFHLPLAAAQASHYREYRRTTSRDLDLFFCGVAFSNRVQLVRDLPPSVAAFSTCICGAGWPEDLRLCKNIRIPSDQMPDYYSRSIAVLNLGREHSYSNSRYSLVPSTPGPRTFEAAMAGCVQLCFADSLEVGEYFAIQDEILLFDRPEEVIATLEGLKAAPHRADQIGRACQARALAEHTYAHRARHILDICL